MHVSMSVSLVSKHADYVIDVTMHVNMYICMVCMIVNM